MSRPGRALHDPAKAKWPAIMLQAGVALGASAEEVLDAATVVEFVIGALDIIDDVVDEELDADLPQSRCLNATLALLALAEVATLRLSQRLSPSRAHLFRGAVQDAIAAATIGEDLDILFEQDQNVEETAALDMTSRKSGSLVAMAFRAAASLGTEDAAVLDGVAELGRQVGIIYQLQNDAEACTRGGARSTSDLRLRKKTLPVAYALQCARTEAKREFVELFAPSSGPMDCSQLAEAQRYIADCGALHYTWTVCQAFREQAEAHLMGMEALVGSRTAAALKSLIPGVRAMTRIG
jgi:geranylgeranyl diphosphate synthase type I